MAHIAVTDIEQKHEEDLIRLRGLRLIDDDFMTKVFEDKTCAEFLLKIILMKDELKVISSVPQKDIKNLQGRSVRLDILVQDSLGTFFNVEIQRDDKGAGSKRARYNSALLDANITEPGEDLQFLQDTYVIFITENDVLCGGLPIYHIERIIKEMNQEFKDGEHIIYVNSKIQDESALGKLMHDFLCTDADQMKYKILADRVRYFKEDQEGVKIMCKAMEDMRNAAALEAAIFSAIDAYRDIKMSEEDIKKYIIKKYNLTAENAQEFLNARPAA